MGIKIKSTKSFFHLPAAHRQWFADGASSECHTLHGYGRSVHFVFAGEVDEYGWVFPFGDLKPVKEFLEYYFDHVSLLGADDPGLDTIPEAQLEPGGLLSGLRALPSGVSMEMSSMFIWEHVCPYIYHKTGGRVWVERVESREHERNSAFIEVDEETARNHCEKFKVTGSFLPLRPIWEFEAPRSAITRLES